MRRGIARCPKWPVLTYEDLYEDLVLTGILLGEEDLMRTLRALIQNGSLFEPEPGCYAFAVTEEELELALAAEPIDAGAAA